MNLIGLSINHKTAHIDLREELYLSNDEIINLIERLKGNVLTSGFILSTCNRTEVFGFTNNGTLDYHPLLQSLLDFKKVDGLTEKEFEKFFSCSAVRHIYRVTTGVDSLIIGDSQILGQAKKSFRLANDIGFSDSVLRKLFDTSVKVGKRAIKETRIGEGAVTVSFAAVQLVEKIFANIQQKSVLVIGAGETGELAATHLVEKGVKKIDIANRTIARAEKLAKRLNANVLPFDKLSENLHEYDIIFSATSSDRYLIEKEDVKRVMKKRKWSPLCLMDIALPRDIDPSSIDIDNVFYNDIDSLNVIVNQNLKKRSEEIPQIEKIILEEMINFFSWYNTLNVVPTIKAIREFFEGIGLDELSKIKHKISKEDYQKVEDMTKRLIGRILHNPTVKLKEIAESGDHPLDVTNKSYIVRDLFNLNSITDGNE